MNDARAGAWSPSSWRGREAAQLPDYADVAALAAVERRLSSLPPLVFDGEVTRLRADMAKVASGEAFLLQGGDCAESFDGLRPDAIRDNLRAILQMAIVLTFGSGRRVVKIGRVAGQFAKPRSAKDETRGDQTFPVYRGDIVNGFAFDAASRAADPARMERAYFASAATLNYLRSLTKGGFADLHEIHRWNLAFARNSPGGSRYARTAERIEETLRFMRAAGIDEGGRSAPLETIEFYTSHEALLLPYEEALVRHSEANGAAYGGSGHFLWIGERTRQIDGAHVEFARGLINPIGLKCGPDADADDLIRLIDRLNPLNEPGKLTLIPRMGARKIATRLPGLLRRVKAEGRAVAWCSDPMHGNTYSAASGRKTRSFEDVLSEARAFFEIHRAEGTVAGGVHVELTGRNVTECTGGDQKISEEQLDETYESLCDPRLNASQALELAFQLAD